MNEEIFLEIIASANENKTPKVKGVAYTGGKMLLGGWSRPVVVDLDGLTLPETVPLLADHWNYIGARMGIVTPTIEGGKILIEGEIVAEGEEALNIVKQGKAGADWQLSIGASVDASTLVESGSRVINGKTHEAPFYHVTASTLREVSVVALGADRNTKMTVTATALLNQHNEGKPLMNEEEIKAEAAKVERDRVLGIKAACNGECNELEAQAIEAGWSVEETAKKVLEHIRASRPAAPAIIVKEDGMTTKTLEASLAMRAGVEEADLIKSYGEKAVEAASPEMSLRDVVEASLKLEGRSFGRFGNDTIRAAFSTVSLPGILSNVANKALLKAYKAYNIIATKVCSEADLADFKVADRYRLTDMGDLQPLAPGGEIVHGSMTEEKAQNQLNTYAKMFSLDRQMIINDDLGAFLQIPTAMGNRAARLVDQLFFKRLMANPNNLFSAANANLLSGDTSVLGVDALKKAIAMFLEQVDADGQPINIDPKYLVVPPALKYTALELVRSATILATGGNGKIIPTMNALAGEGIEVIASPYLSNANYTGNSATAWYLFGDPAMCDTFEIGYLRGKRTPTVEVADTDFNTLGKQFRCFFDIGVREIDHRSMVKSAGK